MLYDMYHDNETEKHMVLYFNRYNVVVVLKLKLNIYIILRINTHVQIHTQPSMLIVFNGEFI